MSASTLMKVVPVYPAESKQRGLKVGGLKVGGVAPFTATDYPGKLAAVVFIQGCPWRCGYCHNPHLQERTQASAHTWDEARAFLERRVGLIDAVVFSGGEPTTDPFLHDAIRDAKAMGLAVGLHTAGAYPRKLAALLPELDWVGLDIKAPPGKYDEITQVSGSAAPAYQSAKAILESGIAYEFRTTIHPALLSDDDILGIGRKLRSMGAQNLAVQQFRKTGCGDASLHQPASADYPSELTLEKLRSSFTNFIIRRS